MLTSPTAALWTGEIERSAALISHTLKKITRNKEVSTAETETNFKVCYRRKGSQEPVIRAMNLCAVRPGLNLFLIANKIQLVAYCQFRYFAFLSISQKSPLVNEMNSLEWEDVTNQQWTRDLHGIEPMIRRQAVVIAIVRLRLWNHVIFEELVMLVQKFVRKTSSNLQKAVKQKLFFVKIKWNKN